MKWIQYKHMVLVIGAWLVGRLLGVLLLGALIDVGIDEGMNTILVSYRLNRECMDL